MAGELRTIPQVDLRHTGKLALVKEYEHFAHELMKAARKSFGPLAEIAAYGAMPVGDYFSRRWLERTQNPYLSDIRDIAAHLNTHGIWALNMCYEWGCTTSLQQGDDGCHMLRTLDWPFPALGETIIVTHEAGAAGEFFNITWPGLVGIYTAMAPDRFALAINQAPMRSATGFMPLDWMLNRVRLGRETGLPPSHLARHVFEHAKTYEEALQMLVHTPVCLPVIFTLSGTEEHEGCIIERQERAAYVRPLLNTPICTTNHWVATPTAERWLPREPDSYGRKGMMDSLLEEFQADDFGWLQSPVLNINTRVAAIMNAQTATLGVLGLNGDKPVTHFLTI